MKDLEEFTQSENGVRKQFSFDMRGALAIMETITNMNLEGNHMQLI